MPSKKELEAKIRGLEFVIEHMKERVDTAISVSKKNGDPSFEFERGMCYQAEILAKSFDNLVMHGSALEKELIDMANRSVHD